MVELVELSSRQMVELDGVVELLNGRRVKLVELSNHRMVELWSWWSCRIVETSNGGMEEYRWSFQIFESSMVK